MSEATTTAPAAPAPAPAAPAPAPTASAPAAPAAPASAPVEAPAAAPAAPAADTLFSKTEAPAPAPAAEGRPDWLPEKYAVMGADGKLDLQASSQKLAEGYAAASKRIGTGDLPPENAAGYVDSPVPEQFKDVPLDPTLTGPFRERMHKLGLTQAQLDGVMGEYWSVVPAVLNGAARVTADEARAELSKVWSDPAELQRQMSHAERAVSAMPEALAAQVREKYGTDPLFWQFAAHYGKEVGEDTPPASGGSVAPVGDVEAIMRTEAYRNPKHPDHEKVSAQVRRAFEKRHGTGSVMT